jgi:alkylhydroperoxidase family enzyme
VSNEKLLAIPDYAKSTLFDERDKVALEYADRITITDQDVTNEFFDLLKRFFNDDEIVELTAAIAWENCSSKFNRTLRVSSQQLWSG